MSAWNALEVSLAIDQLAYEDEDERELSWVRPSSIPIEPEWPVEHRCQHCNARVYIVEKDDGEKIRIDVDPLELILERDITGTQRVVRQHRRFGEVDKTCGGFELLDPVLFTGYVAQGDTKRCGPSVPAWFWYVRRVGLDDAFVHSTAIFSDHYVTCERTSEYALTRRKSAAGFQGEACGDGGRRLRLQRRALAAQQVAADQPQHYREGKRGQMEMF